MHRDSKSGFTLIEIVVAVSIVAIILTVAYSALGQIGRSKQALDDARDVRLIANALLNRVAREFQLASSTHSLLPPPGSSGTSQDSPFQMVGESRSLGDRARGDSVRFVALEGGQYLPDGGAHSGAVQISYRVDENPEEQSNDPNTKTYVLVREEVPLIRPLEKAYEKAMVFPITDRLVSFSLSYYNRSDKTWSDSWESSLPGLVRFSVELRSPLGKIHRFTSAVPLKSQK